MNALPVELKSVMQAAGSVDYQVAMAAQREFAKALELPAKKGIQAGNNLGNIFEVTDFEPGQQIEYPTDPLAPGTENQFVAYTMPNAGRIPNRHVQGDYVAVPVYWISDSVDTHLQYVQDGRFDVVRRLFQILEGCFVAKLNRDGWRVIITAAANRNIQIYDDTSGLAAGQFTPRLVALMMTSMRRYAGGNFKSMGKARLTDLYMSPECAGDMRTWSATFADDFTRREMFVSGEGELAVPSIFGVKLHVLDELGVGQEYQNFFTNAVVHGGLGGTLSDSNTELLVGLDLSIRDSFVQPVRQPLQITEDPTLHRENKIGWYGRMRTGFAAITNRRCLLGSC